MNDALLPALPDMSRCTGVTGVCETDAATCPNCRAALQAAAKYCAECGLPIISDRAGQTASPAPVRERAERRTKPVECDDSANGLVRTMEMHQAKAPSSSNSSRVVAAPSPCTCTGARIIFTQGARLRRILIKSRIAAPVGEVTIPIVSGNGGNGFLCSSAKNPSRKSLSFNSWNFA